MPTPTTFATRPTPLGLVAGEDAAGMPPGDALLSWRAVSLVWLLPTVADVAGMYMGARVSGAPTPFWSTAARVAPVWAVWVPLTALIFWLARCVPIWTEPDATRGTAADDARPTHAVRTRVLSWRGVATHAAASVLAALIHAAVIATSSRLWGTSRPSWGAEMTMTVQDWLPISLLLYWMTLGAAVALERVAEARAQERRTVALEGRLAQAELAVLRAQLEPHFLFNALNTAVSLVRAGEPAAGVDVLTRLADVLRHLLDGVAQETPLADELRLLDSYLGIARARFGERLTVTVDVPPTLGDAVVPGLALQPLVENALRHGVGRREGPGRVWVDAWVASPNETGADVLHLRVRDDGPGLAASASGTAATAGTGVGLRNLRDRLQRLYGGRDAGLTLHERAGGGAEATVWLPLRQPGDAATVGPR